MLPVCSACDPKIGKWHGQFPRLFGAFLVTPRPTSSPREALASLVSRLRLAEVSLNDNMTGHHGQAGKGPPAPDNMFCFDDPIPSYKPVTAPLVGGTHRASAAS
jgi:hypothetical protein